MLVKLRTSCNIDNYFGIQKQINNIKALTTKNNTLISFLKDKFLDTLNETIIERLTTGGGAEENTNQEFISQYIQNNKIKDVENGFILYNDTTIPQSDLEITSNKKANYPNGFSVALAFEYGTGIIGENAGYTNDYFNHWEYNVNNYNFGWRYKKNGVTYATYGYQGMEIYRYTVIKIKERMKDWILEYGGMK